MKAVSLTSSSSREVVSPGEVVSPSADRSGSHLARLSTAVLERRYARLRLRAYRPGLTSRQEDQLADIMAELRARYAAIAKMEAERDTTAIPDRLSPSGK